MLVSAAYYVCVQKNLTEILMPDDAGYLYCNREQLDVAKDLARTYTLKHKNLVVIYGSTTYGPEGGYFQGHDIYITYDEYGEPTLYAIKNDRIYLLEDSRNGIRIAPSK